MFKKHKTVSEYTRKDGVIVRTTRIKGFLHDEKRTQFIRPERKARV